MFIIYIMYIFVFIDMFNVYIIAGIHEIRRLNIPSGKWSTTSIRPNFIEVGRNDAASSVWYLQQAGDTLKCHVHDRAPC